MAYLFAIKVIVSLKWIIITMLYVSPLVTIKKIPIKDTQKKMRKESKHVTTKQSAAQGKTAEIE